MTRAPYTNGDWESRINAGNFSEEGPLPEKGREAYLRSLVADIPDPRTYAFEMPAWQIEIMATAYYRDGWFIAFEEHAAMLRKVGLVGYGTRGLTAFGIAVRRELKAMDA